jgi:hypothetical protein
MPSIVTNVEGCDTSASLSTGFTYKCACAKAGYQKEKFKKTAL